MPVSLIMAVAVGTAVGVGTRRLVPTWQALPWWVCALICSAAAAGGDMAVQAATGDTLSRLQELIMQVLFAGIGGLTMTAALQRKARTNEQHDPSRR
ncbi:hypothetical protein M1L60_44405 [Actinoplanes sp. TRM 88003]|uniref:Uncharacterized protein n=1 Tax=Paractinoplanes aksuensis TaxID=2939490 RepID=A0ABT1E3L5_9ACTN|nr:hypothetical protein [Actinoplanes aksuensis]MCO8277642.1 hypothetical protein [Actinoplanes aksuensis]